jgi:hypothetical protein
MKSAFIITSALNTKFGVYTAEQRLAQTLETIASIKHHVPDALIIAVELAAISPSSDQYAIMRTNTDHYVNLSEDPNIIAIYNSTNNWDIVKSTTEVMGFSNALRLLLTNNSLNGIDRVFKISGRYTLSDTFDISQFEELPGRIVVANRRPTQFGPAVTGGIVEQYMSRLWSWPIDETPTVINCYEQGLMYIAQTMSAGGYCDIEHMLFKFLPAELVTEVARVGIQGNISPNGQPVVD